jgi:hypothetical protein
MIDRASLDWIAKNSSCSRSLGRRILSALPASLFPSPPSQDWLSRLLVKLPAELSLIDLAVLHTITSSYPTETPTNAVMAARSQSITRADAIPNYSG